MFRNGNDESVLNIPSSILSYKFKPPTKYKSPQPSPIAIKPNHRPSYKPSDSFKENFEISDCSSKISRKSSTNPTKSHTPLESIGNTSENVVDLENFIQKFHPALSQKSTVPIKQQIEALASNNKNLKAMIKAKEGEHSQQLLEQSNKIAKNIQKTQNEIDSLEVHLKCLENESKMKEREEIRKLASENESLSELTGKIKSLIVQYKQNGIKHSQFSVLQQKLIELETIQESLISKNESLKKELSSQILTNSSSRACLEHSANVKNLCGIYSQILKLEKISKKYLAHESINICEIIDCEEIQPQQSIPNMIALIRKQTSSLRVIVSDIYAENCGESCLNQ